MGRETLREVFKAHKGKTSDKWDFYLEAYEEVFAPLRDEPISILELGVQNGGSLEIWSDYFSRAKVVVGVDIDPLCATLSFQDERITVVIGDAKTAKTRDEIASRSPLFDIIIDDGSHISSDIIATFLRVVPLLADNGVYLVEDMHTSYWKEFGGELFAPYSAAAFFKTLTDVLNYEHWSLNKPPADLLQPFAQLVQVSLPMHDLERIESVTFLNSLCIIKKTGGDRRTLGPRRMAGTQSDVTRIGHFPVETFARKNELNSAEDYFWAWQPQPPMEALAAKAQLAVSLERQAAEDGRQIIELERDLVAVQEQIGRKGRELTILQEHHKALRGELEQQKEKSKKKDRDLALLRKRRFALGEEMDALNEQVDALNEEVAGLRQHLAQIRRSSSWRITGPLRFAKRAVDRGHRGMRALRQRLLPSGAIRTRQKLSQRGMFFHLDQPLGRIVPRRRTVTFKGWALDTNTKEAAELRLFADGQTVRVDRYKRQDVAAAFEGEVSDGAETAFEASVPLRRRSTWVRIELRLAPEEWVVIHRAFMPLRGPIDETDLRLSRTYDPAEWQQVLQGHLEEQIDEMKEHINAMVRCPTFLVVIDARKDERALDVTLASLRLQNYRAARVVVQRGRLAEGTGITPSGLEIAGDDAVQRIDDLDLCDPGLAEMDYVLFLEPGDQLVPSALYTIASAINREPTSAMIYTDEMFRTSSGEPLPFHKPTWSPDYLESFDYIGHSGFFSMARARELSAPFTSVYDFTLRFTESLSPDCVLHLDQLLIERGAPFARSAASDNDLAAIRGRLERTGRSGVIVPAASGTNCYHARVRWERMPEVSIVIPTAGYTRQIDGREIDLIVNITQQIVERSTYRTAEIIVVDNGDLSCSQRAHLARLGCRTVTFDEPALNIAKKINLGAALATGDLLLLMNDDMEIIQEDWIERLCDHFAKPEVGVVGCKLLYLDRSIQHVGVIQYRGNPDHVRRGFPADEDGYFNSTCGVRNYLAVTGACMMTRKTLYKKVGGYRPELAVSFNDVDFCLKVREAGYRTVYTGDVALVHMESLSRVPFADPEEVRFYHQRWTPNLTLDPYYNDRFFPLLPPTFHPKVDDRVL